MSSKKEKKSPVKFNAVKSTILSSDQLIDWVRAPVSGELTQIPGVGARSKAALQEEGINTTFQLFGKFLSMKDVGVSPVELVDNFFGFINSVMPQNKYKHSVVRAIAEKIDLMFGEGIVFDVSHYPELSGELSPVHEVDDENYENDP